MPAAPARSKPAKQRAVQRQVARADAKPKAAKPKAMQAGARRYPEPPMPAKHQAKPGKESALGLAPQTSSYITGEVLPIIGGYGGG
jgi:hypothetical protein